MPTAHTAAEQDRLLTADEAAHLLNVTPIALRDWRFNRQGPPWLKLGHRTVRYARADLDDWLKRQRVTAAR